MTSQVAKHKRPAKQIHLRRRFYQNSQDPVYYAVRYLEQHPDMGSVNTIMLNLLQHFYSPLGVKAFGDPDESLRAAMQSIAILEGHVSYLKTMFGLTSSGGNTISYTVPKQLTQSWPNELSDSRPETDGDAELAVNLFNSFEQE